MGKYFSNDSDLSNYNLSDDATVDTSTLAMPLPSNLTQTLDHKSKEILSGVSNDSQNIQPQTTDEHINFVRQQNNQVRQLVNSYSEEMKESVKNQFEMFSPAEIFEKFNQIIYVLTDLSNRITSLENTVKSGNTVTKQPAQEIEISDPEQLIRFQKMLEKGITPNTQPEMNKNNVNQILTDIKKGNGPRTIPGGDYIDKGVNLEEMFPHLDDEAYQAAYKAMSETKNPKTESITPAPGSMRGITGF